MSTTSNTPKDDPTTTVPINNDGSPVTVATRSNKWSLTSQSWCLPWILTIVALYIVALPWMYVSILDRYFIQQTWNGSLIGLDTTPARKFFMGTHMICGALAILLGPTQFSATLRRKLPKFHRFSGRLYVLCALLSAICGLIFVCLKGFILVGGLNMGLAFCTAGILFFVCAFFVYWHASHGRFQQHVHWTIRSYSQVLSPFLYRYFYLILLVPGWYDNGHDVDLCDTTEGTCPAFLETFDRIHAWTYFLFPLLVAELIIWSLPKGHTTITGHPDYAAANVQEDPHPNDDEDEEEHPTKTNSTTTVPETSRKTRENNYFRLNLVGFMLAIVTLSMTGVIYIVGAISSDDDNDEDGV